MGFLTAEQSREPTPLNAYRYLPLSAFDPTTSGRVINQQAE